MRKNNIRKGTIKMTRIILTSVLAITVLACDSDRGFEPYTDGADEFWFVRAQNKSLTMAVGDELDFPMNITDRNGNSLAEKVTMIQRFSADSNSVYYSDDGRVAALAPVSQLRVITRVTVGRRTAADTSYISVTQDRVDVESIRLMMPPGDSARRAIATYGYPILQFNLVGGGTATGLSAFLSPAIAPPHCTCFFNQGLSVYGYNRGPIWLYAEANLYGKSFKDSLLFTFLDPVSTFVDFSYTDQNPQLLYYMGSSSTKKHLYLQPGSQVSFSSGRRNSADVSFRWTDPSMAPTPDQLLTIGASFTAQLTTLGDYPWIAIAGTDTATGSFTVREQP